MPKSKHPISFVKVYSSSKKPVLLMVRLRGCVIGMFRRTEIDWWEPNRSLLRCFPGLTEYPGRSVAKKAVRNAYNRQQDAS